MATRKKSSTRANSRKQHRPSRAAKVAPRTKTLMVTIWKHKPHGGFAKGTGGRPKGAKDKVPRKVRVTQSALAQEMVEKNAIDIERRMRDGALGPADSPVTVQWHELLRKLLEPDNLNITFKDDELTSAQKELQRKMDALFKHASRITIEEHAST